jgi:hypothetical protein
MMAEKMNTRASPYYEIRLSEDFPDIEDVEGYVEQPDPESPDNMLRTHFYRTGDGMSHSVIPCTDVNCEAGYFLREILLQAYSRRAIHEEGSLPYPACSVEKAKNVPCRARYSVDIRFKSPAEVQKNATAIEDPGERWNLY